MLYPCIRYLDSLKSLADAEQVDDKKKMARIDSLGISSGGGSSGGLESYYDTGLPAGGEDDAYYSGDDGGTEGGSSSGSLKPGEAEPLLKINKALKIKKITVSYGIYYQLIIS